MSSDSLPEGWATARLGELLEPAGLFDGPFGSNLKTSDYTQAGVRVIRLENVANLRFVEDKHTYISHSKYASLAKHTVAAGDLIVGSFVDGAVRVCVLPQLQTKAIAKADCFCVRPRPELDRRFLAFQLGTDRTRDALVEDIHGATRPRITTRQLRDFEIQIAPLAEQRRIVEKVEALLAHVRAARVNLETVPVILNRLRLSILAAACSGRLTEDWREGHPGGKPAAGESRGTSVAIPDGAPFNPPQWRLARVDEIAEVRGGIQKQPKRAPRKNAFPYLRVANVLRARLDLERVERMELFDNELELYRLLPGDLLVVEGNGSMTEIGRSAVWGGEIDDCVHQNHIIRVRPQGCLPHYLNYFWNSPVGIEEIATAAVTTSGLYSLSTKKVASLHVPIPPLHEQREIISRVDSLFAIADAIERRMAVANACVDKMNQTILAKGFRGDLVSTEAELARQEGREYESATALLDRLRGEQDGAVDGSAADRPRRRGRRTAPSSRRRS
jgi:type I restriction enzyme S subunit